MSNTHDSAEYSDLLLLDNLESLLEDLEDAGALDDLDLSHMPTELADRVRDADVTSLDELRSMIAKLHAGLDSAEGSV